MLHTGRPPTTHHPAPTWPTDDSFRLTATGVPQVFSTDDYFRDRERKSGLSAANAADGSDDDDDAHYQGGGLPPGAMSMAHQPAMLMQQQQQHMQQPPQHQVGVGMDGMGQYVCMQPMSAGVPQGNMLVHHHPQAMQMGSYPAAANYTIHPQAMPHLSTHSAQHPMHAAAARQYTTMMPSCVPTPPQQQHLQHQHQQPAPQPPLQHSVNHQADTHSCAMLATAAAELATAAADAAAPSAAAPTPGSAQPAPFSSQLDGASSMANASKSSGSGAQEATAADSSVSGAARKPTRLTIVPPERPLVNPNNQQTMVAGGRVPQQGMAVYDAASGTMPQFVGGTGNGACPPPGMIQYAPSGQPLIQQAGQPGKPPGFLPQGHPMGYHVVSPMASPILVDPSGVLAAPHSLQP